MTEPENKSHGLLKIKRPQSHANQKFKELDLRVEPLVLSGAGAGATSQSHGKSGNRKRNTIDHTKSFTHADFALYTRDELHTHIHFLTTYLQSILENLDHQIRHCHIDMDEYHSRLKSLEAVDAELALLRDTTKLNDPTTSSHSRKMDHLMTKVENELRRISKYISPHNLSLIFPFFIYDLPLFLREISQEYNDLFHLFHAFFQPLSVELITEERDVENIHKIVHSHAHSHPQPQPPAQALIQWVKPMDTKSGPFYRINAIRYKTLEEKIEGLTIYYPNPSNHHLIAVHGLFKKDSLHHIKSAPIPSILAKMREIEEDMEYLDMPPAYKKLYISQIPTRDFIALSRQEILHIAKADYEELTSMKNKNISILVKEFLKSPIEKQRRIINLFLIYGMQTQFIAHTIYDLLISQNLTAQGMPLYDLIYQSLHWRVQILFRSSKSAEEDAKKKITNFQLTDIPYDQRIASLQSGDHVKAKACEKLKEINGSKDNSVKAQQWLDGLLKIPFGVYKEEKIIKYFEIFQSHLSNYVEVATLKIGAFDQTQLNDLSKQLYHLLMELLSSHKTRIIHHSDNEYDQYIERAKEVLIKFMIYMPMLMANVRFEYSPEKMIEYRASNRGRSRSRASSISLTDEPSEEAIGDDMRTIHMWDVHEEFDDDDVDDADHIIDVATDYQLDPVNTFFQKFVIKNFYEIEELILSWTDFKKSKKEYMKYMDKTLDKCVHGHLESKQQIKRLVGQMMASKKKKGFCLGLQGPPGVGKTTICLNGLAKCLVDENGENRPIIFLPLGGSANGSTLEGHNYTYLGSTWGKIADALMEAKCMNPIIFIDELDKISKTEHGREIASILTHITDQTQNTEFFDKYFQSVPLDLSKVIFIFSYNDRNNVDKILLDRIQEVKIAPLSKQDKVIISKNYVLPDIYRNTGFSKDEINFPSRILSNIIENYTFEAGVRKLSEILNDIIREINLRRIMGTEYEFPIMITEALVDEILGDRPKMSYDRILTSPLVGVSYGMYASSAGYGGGISKIQTVFVPSNSSNKKIAIQKTTGLAGEMMKESFDVCMSVAYNLIPDDIKKLLLEREDNGIHIHFNDSSVNKDGPSGGQAITLSIVSLLTNTKVRNNVAITGEINLLGFAMKIGGLPSKINGSIRAGVNTFIVPKENREDIVQMIRTENRTKKNLVETYGGANSQSSPSLSSIGIPLQKTSSFLNLDYSPTGVSIKKVTDDIEFEECDEYPGVEMIYYKHCKVYLVENIYQVLQIALVDNEVTFRDLF